ncbi:MAG: VWA domain-containing protein [Pyrinomonadaceae bacterium]
MPYGRAVRLGFGLSLVLVALFFSSTASLQQQGKSSLTAGSHPAHTSPAESGDPAGDDRIVVSTDLISFDVTVMDGSGRHVAGLPKTAFTIFDEKRPQEISFFGEVDSPISVGIVFDLTGSMTEKKVGRAREAIARFMETSRDDDEYYLVTMSEGKALLSLDGTRDSQAVTDKLTNTSPHGGTALYDACYLGLNKVSRGTLPRRALLVISDGQDNSSRHTRDELRNLLKESDVRIYTIGVGENDSEYSTLLGEKVLTEIADESGGKYFHPQSAEGMYETFERIALELRQQYALGYRPPNFTTDGSWHRVKVKLAPPAGSTHLFLRYRSGYYARSRSR